MFLTYLTVFLVVYEVAFIFSEVYSAAGLCKPSGKLNVFLMDFIVF